MLCAGIGERLRPLTNTTNKSLLNIPEKDVTSRTMIEHFLAGLITASDKGKAFKIDAVHVVIGHYGYKFRKTLGKEFGLISFQEDSVMNIEPCLKIRFHENPLFNITGAAQSLYTVADVMRRGPCLILEGDHYMDPALIHHLMTSEHENCMLVDPDLTRLKYDEETIVYGYQGVVEHLQWLPPYPENPIGEALTLFKLGEKASKDLASVLEHYLLEDGPAKREIIEPINRLMEAHDIHYALTTGHQWIEIDTLEDLEKARKMKWR